MTPSRYVLPLLLVTLSGLMYILYIEGAYLSIRASQAKIRDVEQAIESTGEIRDLQAKLLAQVESIDVRDREKLEKLLPATLDPVRIVYDLDIFAGRHGLMLKNPIVVIPPEDKAKSAGGKVTTMQIKFTLTAPYPVFRVFMSDLEKELGLRDIHMLSLKGKTAGIPIFGAPVKGSGGDSGVFTYDVEVEGYAYQTPQKPK